MKKNFAFTLAELLISLTVIGIVATLAIPVVIENTIEREHKILLKKAVKNINDAISLNIAKGNGDLFTFQLRNANLTLPEYLSLNLDSATGVVQYSTSNVTVFETKDGVKYIFPRQNNNNGSTSCGSYGLGITDDKNPQGRTATSPCTMVIDVNKGKNLGSSYTNSIENLPLNPKVSEQNRINNFNADKSVSGAFAVFLTDKTVVLPPDVANLIEDTYDSEE